MKKRKYTHRTLQEKIDFFKAKLASQESYHQKHLASLEPLRQKIHALEQKLQPAPAPVAVTQ